MDTAQGSKEQSMLIGSSVKTFFKALVLMKLNYHQSVIVNRMSVVLFIRDTLAPYPTRSRYTYLNQQRKCCVRLIGSCRYNIQHRSFGGKAHAVLTGFHYTMLYMWHSVHC